MDYKEWYRVDWKDVHGESGTFGPYPCEEDAMQLMKKIQNKHDHVKHIYWAHMYRVSEVMLAGYARAT